MYLGLPFVLFLFGNVFNFAAAGAVEPEQVTLAYNGNPTEMMVTWITTENYNNPATKSQVHYQRDGSPNKHKVFADVINWKNEVSHGWYRNTHRAILTDLRPGSRYQYTVGSDEGISKPFKFTAVDPSKSDFQAAIFGDLGVTGNRALPSLLDAAKKGKFDIVFHIGDFAYDLNDDDGKKGDHFMNSIQDITASVPYMVVAGNHEQFSDFQNYKYRFTMPPNGVRSDNQFWSMDFRGVHFIGLSSEYANYKMHNEAIDQYMWLEKDLSKNSQPWTIMFQHRPYYCSNWEKTHCNDYENIVTRVGANGMPGIETLVNKKGVDMAFWGHIHTYERFYPVYQELTFKQRDPQHFHNSPTTVYTLTGAAGCHDHISQSKIIPAPYSAARLGNYGYSVIHVYNSTFLRTHFVPADSPSSILDHFTLSKDNGYKPGQKL